MGQLDLIKHGKKGKCIHFHASGLWRRTLDCHSLSNLCFVISRSQNVKNRLKHQQTFYLYLAINTNSLLWSFHLPSCCSRKFWVKKHGVAQGQLIALRWQKILEQLTKWPWEGTGPWLKVTVGKHAPRAACALCLKNEKIFITQNNAIKKYTTRTHPMPTHSKLGLRPRGQIKIWSLNISIGRKGGAGVVWFLVHTGVC